MGLPDYVGQPRFADISRLICSDCWSGSLCDALTVPDGDAAAPECPACIWSQTSAFTTEGSKIHLNQSLHMSFKNTYYLYCFSSELIKKLSPKHHSRVWAHTVRGFICLDTEKIQYRVVIPQMEVLRDKQRTPLSTRNLGYKPGDAEFQ